MNRVFSSLNEWTARLVHEYPGVSFMESNGHPPGVNAVTAGVLVGRFFPGRKPAYGIMFNQPRSCDGRN